MSKLVRLIFVMLIIAALGLLMSCGGGGGDGGSQTSNSGGDGAGNTTTTFYNIQGQVFSTPDIAGVTSGVGNVLITVGNKTTTTLSTLGYYKIDNLANGTYTITPSLAGYTFSPATITVTINGSSRLGNNFTAIKDSSGSNTGLGKLTVGNDSGATIHNLKTRLNCTGAWETVYAGDLPVGYIVTNDIHTGKRDFAYTTQGGNVVEILGAFEITSSAATDVKVFPDGLHYISGRQTTSACGSGTGTGSGSQIVNCQVSNWASWSGCSNTCGGGIQTRSRSIITQPANGGAACPALTESQACNTQACSAPPETASIALSITDSCNDGYRIDYKFFDETNNLLWPSSTEIYYTNYYNTKYTSNLACKPGANICFGGTTGNTSWGVGVNNTNSCTGCCVTCAESVTYSWNLTCGGSSGGGTGGGGGSGCSSTDTSCLINYCANNYPAKMFWLSLESSLSAAGYPNQKPSYCAAAATEQCFIDGGLYSGGIGANGQSTATTLGSLISLRDTNLANANSLNSNVVTIGGYTIPAKCWSNLPTPGTSGSPAISP